MKRLEYPWNHLFYFITVTLVLVLIYLLLPSGSRFLIYKVTVLAVWLMMTVYIYSCVMLERKQRFHTEVFAAQERFLQIFEQGTPFSIHHPRNPQETKDIKLLIRAIRDKTIRQCLHPRMVEWVKTIQRQLEYGANQFGQS